MKLRCFFGKHHGKWVEATPTPDASIWPFGCMGGGYVVNELVPGYSVLIAEEHGKDEALAWLFTFQPDHPKYVEAENHPRQIAKAKWDAHTEDERRNRPGMSGY